MAASGGISGTATARKYAVIDPASGKLDRRIFSEQAIYDEEMEKILGRAWLMIGHESLVPAPDDFFHTYMGEDPVILTRDGQGRLHGLLNMCRHRGNRVCRVDDGNAKRFMCTYHGWTYRNDELTTRLEHVAIVGGLLLLSLLDFAAVR
jgi:nitrite reductase/ring-hydroxylating ferredoxin subunit